jgi:hypothetical protein
MKNRIGKMKKNIGKKTCKERAAIEREFIVKESYNGTRKLSDILADLLYAEYCRKEQKSAR